MSNKVTNKSDEELIAKMTSVVQQNISDAQFNANAFCQKLGMSKTILYSRLKNISGQTVNEFIRTYRLNKSLELLAEGKYNITQISEEMGFNSLSYFSRSFTKLFGLSPKQYISTKSIH
jgi:AraC-like DNA-binding protein